MVVVLKNVVIMQNLKCPQGDITGTNEQEENAALTKRRSDGYLLNSLGYREQQKREKKVLVKLPKHHFANHPASLNELILVNAKEDPEEEGETKAFSKKATAILNINVKNLIDFESVLGKLRFLRDQEVNLVDLAKPRAVINTN